MGRRDHARRHAVRAAHLPRREDPGAGPRRAARRASRRPRLPDRRVAFRRRDPPPADGPQRRARCGRAVGGGGREHGGASDLHRGPRRGADRGGLPGDRTPGGDVGAASPDRLRVPLRRRLPAGGAPHAHPRGAHDLPELRDGADLAPELGAALRDPAPDLDGGGRRADAGGGAHADRRRWDLAGGAGRDPRRGCGRSRHERLPLDVSPVPCGRARLRPLEGDGARDLSTRGRPGRRDLGRARGHHRQPLAREHAVGYAPVREPGGPPAPDFGARRHGPVHGLRAGGRRVHGDAGRHRGRRHGERHEPGAGGRGAFVGVARSLARGARRRGPLHGGELGRPGGLGDGRPRPPMRRRWWSGTRTT